MLRLPSRTLLLATAVTAVALFAGIGCPDMGGANHNGQGVGDRPGGITVGLGNIGVAPTGDYVVFQNASELSVGLTESGEVYKLPVKSPTRLEFANESDIVWVGSDDDHKVHAVDVMRSEILWSIPVPHSDTGALRLSATSNDNRLVISSGNEVIVVDAYGGDILRKHTVESGVIDLHILSDDTRAIAVSTHSWGPTDEGPSTPITILDLKNGSKRSFDVPNCSDRLAVSGDARYALLAPLSCRKDPVSVIDLKIGEESFVRNLPGFGPVAMASTGHHAVAWLDVTNMDEALFDDPSQVPAHGEGAPRYHLMVIDTNSLTYTFHAVGDVLPRYSMTPDGRVVLVDDAADGATRIFDLEDGRFHTIDGPELQLDHYTMTSDSRDLYGLRMLDSRDTDFDSLSTENVLFHIDILERTSGFISAPFMPSHINISADDAHLFLRRSSTSLCVYEIAAERCVQNLQSSGEPDESENDGAYRTTG